MFVGSYSLKLDDVGRCIIARKLRHIGDEFFITRGSGCLMAFTSQSVHELHKQAMEKAGSLMEALFDEDMKKIRYQLFSEMYEAKADGQYRVQLPPELRTHAGIDKDAVMIGMGDWIEIWNPERWQEFKDKELTGDRLAQAVARKVAVSEGGGAGESVPPSCPAE